MSDAEPHHPAHGGTAELRACAGAALALLLGCSPRVSASKLSDSPPEAMTSTDPPAYSSLVLGDSPAAYWRLGESSDLIAVDSSPNGRDAIYSSGVTYGRAGAIVGDSNTAVLPQSNPVFSHDDQRRTRGTR